jgi:hypothetical protein
MTAVGEGVRGIGYGQGLEIAAGAYSVDHGVAGVWDADRAGVDDGRQVQPGVVSLIRMMTSPGWRRVRRSLLGVSSRIHWVRCAPAIASRSSTSPPHR